jgi:hypothetical protein
MGESLTDSINVAYYLEKISNGAPTTYLKDSTKSCGVFKMNMHKAHEFIMRPLHPINDPCGSTRGS